MRTDVVLTVTGPDRVGIVEEVTSVLLGAGANIGTSRMARLGGEFTILMLASVPERAVADLSPAFQGLRDQDYLVSIRPTAPSGANKDASCSLYRINVSGADHEGIVHEVAAGLARLGINIESIDSGIAEAPVTGMPLFSMVALVSVPDDVRETEWIADLSEAAAQANVDVTVSGPETP